MKSGHPWELPKGFDGSMPVSQFIEKDKVLDSNNLDLVFKINGKII